MEDRQQVAQDRGTEQEASQQPQYMYHRPNPHITQAPIDDAEPSYVTRERYQTLEEIQAGRKHMGVATSDPNYLADAPLSKQPSEPLDPQPTETHRPRGPRGKQTLTHSARYLQTPKPGRSIFMSRQMRRKQQTKRIIIALAALLVIVIIVCFFILK